MKWTPDEAAKLLAERTHQPHYIKWALEQCVKEAMEQASRAVVPSVAVPEGDVLAKALANAARLRNEMSHLIQPSQGDKDLALLGDYIATLRAQLEELSERYEANTAIMHARTEAMNKAHEKLAASEARVGELEALLREAYGYTTAATNLLPERIKAAIAKGGEEGK